MRIQSPAKQGPASMDFKSLYSKEHFYYSY
jgi:hypothetical protein